MNASEVLSCCDGLTYRKLDYWCNAGIFGSDNVHPGFSGRRQFTSEDIKVAAVLAVVSLALSEVFKSLNGASTRTLQVIADEVRHGTDPVHFNPADGVDLYVSVEGILASNGLA